MPYLRRRSTVVRRRLMPMANRYRRRYPVTTRYRKKYSSVIKKRSPLMQRSRPLRVGFIPKYRK